MQSSQKVKEPGISVHHAEGDAEITDLENIEEHTGLKTYTDGDFVKDITMGRSVTSVVHEYNEVTFAWKQSSKQVHYYIPTDLKYEHSSLGLKEKQCSEDFCNTQKCNQGANNII